MRPINCVMMGFAVVVGASIASPFTLHSAWLNLVYGFITGFMLTGASMTINDYYDREIDRINEPNRPIPSGTIKPKEALIFALVLTGIGFVAALLTNPFCLVLAVIAWIVFAGYTTYGKRSGLPGNFLVSTCVAIPFIYGSIVISNAVQANILIFALVAFLSNTGREITKGIVDVEGDKAKGIRTLAVRDNAKLAAIVAVLFYLSAVALSVMPWLLSLVSFWFVPLVVVTDSGILASSFLLLRDYSRENARRVKNMMLLWFIIGLMAFIFGAVG